MRITVFGAGAIGSFFGAALHRAGHDVILVARKKHVTAINKEGLMVVEPDGGVWTADVPAATVIPRKPADLILVTTKAFDNEGAATQLAEHGIENNTSILILQNGVGNEKPFLKRFNHSAVFRGVTSEAAELVSPGWVRHTGSGQTHVGSLSSQSQRLQTFVQSLRKEGLSIHTTKSIEARIWCKVIVNAAINPLGAITGKSNGNLVASQSISMILEAVAIEAYKVAVHVLGTASSLPDPIEEVRSVVMTTSENRCSMLQDLEKGRKTEIDAINGAIVEKGEELGIPTPWNSVLVKAIHFIEANHEEGKKELRMLMSGWNPDLTADALVAEIMAR